MRVLLLNWRDVRSPRAGGAEVLTHEIARRLVSWGHEVTWFTSRPAGLADEEEVDGVRVVRSGSELTTRIRAPGFARRARWDVVVEEINTLPWLSPRWSRAPTVLFMAQLAREVWWYEAPKLLAPIGRAAEPAYLQVYRNVPKITISLSTRDDLRGLGLHGPIHVIPMAVDTEPLDPLPAKEPGVRLITVGRLVPSKRVDHAIEALARLRLDRPDAALAILGGGPEEARLRALAERLGVAGAVTFHGRVGEDEKGRLLAEASLLVACSAREGWGMTVTEAARPRHSGGRLRRARPARLGGRRAHRAPHGHVAGRTRGRRRRPAREPRPLRHPPHSRLGALAGADLGPDSPRLRARSALVRVVPSFGCS